MSSFSPQLLQLLGAVISSSPGSEQQALPSQGGAPSPAQPPAAPQAPASQSMSDTLAQGALSAAQQGRDIVDTDHAAALREVDKGAKKTLDLGAQEKAVDDQVTEKLQPVFQDYLDNMDQFDQQFAAARTETKKRTQAAWDHYMATVNDYSNTHVYNWWGQASTGAKILGVLSQAFAGGLQGLTGQPGAKTPLDRIIDEDVQYQQMNIAKKAEGVSQARGLYSDLNGMLKDQVATEAALRELAYDSTLRRAKSIADQMGAAGQKQFFQLQEQVATKRAELRADILKHHALSAENAAMGLSNLNTTLLGMWVKDERQQQEVPVALTGVANSQYLDKETKRELGGKLSSTATAIRAAQQLKESLDGEMTNARTGAKTKVRDAMGRLQWARQNKQLIAELVLNGKEAFNLGQLAEHEKSAMEDMIGDNASYTNQVLTALGLYDLKDAGTRVGNMIEGLKMRRAREIGSYAVVGPDGQQMPLQYQGD